MSAFGERVANALPFYSVDNGIEHAGVRPSAHGADFENLIISTNIGYIKRKLGVVKKNQVRKMLKNDRLVWLEKSTVDFDGYCLDVGFVAFDCKSCAEDVWRPTAAMLHQHLYLLTGQRMMPRTHARFFYLLQMRTADSMHGDLRTKQRVYLVEDLETLTEVGHYKPRPCDEIVAGTGGILLDYRKKLIETRDATT